MRDKIIRINWKDNSNSLINRWLNDSNPIGVSGKGEPKGKKFIPQKIKL